MTQSNRAARRASRKLDKRLAKTGTVKISDPHVSKLERIRKDRARDELPPDFNQARFDAMYRDLKRELLDAFRRGYPEDGLIRAPLRAATGYAARHIEAEHPDLFGAGDADLFAEWLCAMLGETIRAADLDAFREYAQGRAQRLRALGENVGLPTAATQADDDGDHR